VKQHRALAWGGVVGPIAFVAAWATAGALTKGYSPADEVISQLAAVHAPMRWLMTAGFACFGIAVLGYSLALRGALDGRAWIAATVAALATLGAGACPLDSSSIIDLVHVGFAAIGSASIALTPVLAARPLAARGHSRAAAASRVVGVLAGACLVASTLVPAQGLLQRIGLTLAHAWFAASAVAIIRGRIAPTSDEGVRTS
jgi:hypothetical membrane protein